MNALGKAIAIILLIIPIFHDSLSQEDFLKNNTESFSNECATEERHIEMMRTNVHYRETYTETARKVAFTQKKGLSINQKKANNDAENTVSIIPVVFHVVHLGEPIGMGSNVSDGFIHIALDNLNERFRGEVGGGEDMGIEFCLATRDPNGYQTSGIIRVDGTSVLNYANEGIEWDGSGGANEEVIKDLSKWPTAGYYNIWVVHEIYGWIAGYANFPTTHINDYDGTVIKYIYLNSTTLAHELGHGFNLRHTHAGAGDDCPSNTDCLIQGDGVCDTPPHKSADCLEPNPCSTSGNFNNSRFNYMSYCPGRSIFTNGQKDKVWATIPVTTRNSLLESNGCVPVPEIDAGLFQLVVDECDTTISVRLKNYGTQSLTSVSINWSVDGVLQAPFEWTGSLDMLQEEVVDIGSFMPTIALSYTIEAWTSNPNKVSDIVAFNDRVTLEEQTFGFGIHADEEKPSGNISIIYSNEACISGAQKKAEGLNFNYKYYPNPISDKLIVELVTFVPADVEIVLFDILGLKNVHWSYASLQSGEHKFEIDFKRQSLSSGVYTVMIKVDNASTSFKALYLDQ